MFLFKAFLETSFCFRLVEEPVLQKTNFSHFMNRFACCWMFVFTWTEWSSCNTVCDQQVRFARLLINSMSPSFPRFPWFLSPWVDVVCSSAVWALMLVKETWRSFLKATDTFERLTWKTDLALWWVLTLSWGSFMCELVMKATSHCPLLSDFHRSLTTTGTQMTQCTSWMEKSCAVRGETESTAAYTICIM